MIDWKADNWKLLALIEVASDAGYWGASAREAFDRGFSASTIYTYAVIAARHGRIALRDAGVSYND